MVELQTPLTMRSCVRILLLAGFLTLALRPVEIQAQDGNRQPEPSREIGHLDRGGRGFPDGTWGPNASGERERFSGQFRPEFFEGMNARRVLQFQPGDFDGRQIDDGFIFVDGRFVPGPYSFRSAGELTYVNDILISHDASGLRGNFSEDEHEVYRRSGASLQRTLAEFLSNRFADSTHILVAFHERQPEIVPLKVGGRALLCALVNHENRATLLPDIRQFDQTNEEAEDWSQWIVNYQPTDDFLLKAQPIVDQVEGAHAEDMAKHAAIQRLDRFSYPLSIVGMIMSVFAIGHLLSNPPNGGKSPLEVDDSPEVLQIVTRSLALVVVLSLLDLVWTLLASQAGTMREMNPVGGRLIHDPAMLILFKVALTGLAAGLIFKLRHYRRAQLASWWACLILTLLTVRWLTFNSMLA
jgi:hypothetical protein